MTENASYTREGLSTLSAVSGFLGSIFFAALLILFQSSNSFTANLFAFQIEGFSIIINQRIVIAFPLTISIVLFIFSAFFTATACTSTSRDQDRMAQESVNIFLTGFLSFFASLFVVLAFINFIVAIVAIVFSVALLLWWTKKNWA